MNAKEEFLSTILCYNCKVICASINYGDDEIQNIILPPLYTQNDYDIFLSNLDRINYNSGYGLQHLFGTIFCENGIWFSRFEYDGSESWQMNRYPDIKNYFEEKIVLKYYRSKKMNQIFKNA